MSTTGESLQLLRATATDMTLMLGAESYITGVNRSSEFPLDPKGEQCLVDFIDLVLNSERMHFTLPATADGDPRLLKTALGSKLERFQNAAVVALTQETEEKVFEEFKRLIKASGVDWVY